MKLKLLFAMAFCVGLLGFKGMRLRLESLAAKQPSLAHSDVRGGESGGPSGIRVKNKADV